MSLAMEDRLVPSIGFSTDKNSTVYIDIQASQGNLLLFLPLVSHNCCFSLALVALIVVHIFVVTLY